MQSGFDCIHIGLGRKNWSSIAYLGISNTAEQHYPEHHHFLHPDELLLFENLRFEKLKTEFLTGRFTAKKTLSENFQEPNLRNIILNKGVFNQPIVTYSKGSQTGISWSHSKMGTVALTFPIGHPMGIDIETINNDGIESILPQLTYHEKLMMKFSHLDEGSFYLKLWTIKEALSKALTTGLTVPMSIYEISTMERKGNLYFSEFKNFIQYKAISFCTGGNICSLVLPSKTECVLDNLNAYIQQND